MLPVNVKFIEEKLPVNVSHRSKAPLIIDSKNLCDKIFVEKNQHSNKIMLSAQVGKPS